MDISKISEKVEQGQDDQASAGEEDKIIRRSKYE